VTADSGRSRTAEPASDMHVVSRCEPYWSDGSVDLYLGDLRDVLPQLGRGIVDSCVTDPPYGETAAKWDTWPDGWVDVVGQVLPADASLWCFGTARMFLAQRDEFVNWKFAQEALWAKRNGTGPTSRDRLARVHEWAYHWYRGRWGALHHEWEREASTTPNKGYVRKESRQALHQRAGRDNAWTDDGTRQPRSVVIEAPSVRYQKRHQDEKPLAVVMPLVRECTPLDGTVLDPFAGSATTGVAARLLGRRAVLIEQDEATAEKAAQRLSEPDLLAHLNGEAS
jgi:site-specific DNA-methyltransferase (adenine-specific)